MFDRMSPRQKAAASLAVLGLDSKTVQPLDELVSTVFTNPLVGAVTGLDFSSVSECLEQFYATGSATESAIFTGVRRQLTNEKFRGVISSAITKAISTMKPETQNGIVIALGKLAEMDVPEFNRDFHDSEEFIREGLLVFLANGATPEAAEWCECPYCSVRFELNNKD